MTTPPPHPTFGIGPASRLPDGSWTTLIVSVVVLLLAIAGLEYAGARLGIVAWEHDTPSNWADTYEQAIAEPNSLLIIGSSRTLYGVDPSILERITGRRVFHLGINGGNPRLILSRLQRDRYDGIILLSAMETRFLAPDPRSTQTTVDYLRTLDSPSLVQGLEAKLSGIAATTFRSRTKAMRLLELLKAALRRETPRRVRWNRADRFETVDLDQIDAASMERRWAEALRERPPFSGPERTRALEWVREMEEQMPATIYWVRLPSTGAVAEVEAEQFPRETAYEELAGTHRWHFADDPTTRNLRCYDGSHLTPDDAPRLTETIGEWLREELGD